jgi:hypothetical protein
MVDTHWETREARAEARRDRLYRRFAVGVHAVVGIMIVVAHNLPPPSPEEQARMAFPDAVREQAAAAEIQRKQDAVAQCVASVDQVAPNYNNSFDAY